MIELQQNRRSEVGVPVLAKFYEINIINYVEKWATLFENVNVLQVAIVGLFVLDDQAS